MTRVLGVEVDRWLGCAVSQISRSLRARLTQLTFSQPGMLAQKCSDPPEVTSSEVRNADSAPGPLRPLRPCCRPTHVRVVLSLRAHQEAAELTSGLETALIHLCFRLN